MKKYLGILLAVLLLISPTVSQDKEKRVAFDVQAARSYIQDLASDVMEGRRSGQPGGVMGEEYIASKFKEWGLEPAGDNGSYFHNFTIEHSHVEEGVALEIMAGKARRDFYYGEDWRVQRFSGSGQFVADIVFVGYGIHAPYKGYDDYAGVDIQGKLLLMASGVSQPLQEKFGEAAGSDKIIEAAQKLGARGVIGFRPSAPGQAPGRVSPMMRMDKKLYLPDFVLLSVENKVVDFIFNDLPKEVRQLLRDIDGEAKPQSFDTGVKAFISVKSFFDEKRPTRNVLAKISGSDKKLKEEGIVLGAHQDHLGITPLGVVMNGANDNASGTAVVMELARVMKLSKTRPKRTVVFALWAGEEQGLLGSRHYADHPTFPIEKTIVNINMDMVGHGSGKIAFDGVYYGPQIWEVLKQKLSKDVLDYANPGRGGPGGSDHTPFLEKGVPGFFIITSGAIKYHHNRDDSDLINSEMLKKTGDFVQAAVDILANGPGDFVPLLRQETYQFKYQNLINYGPTPLDSVLKEHGEAKDSHVDLQLAFLEEKEGLSGDSLRLDLINNLLEFPEKIKKAKGLSPFSSSSRLAMDVRQGKTTVIAGLKGMNSFRDNPRWAEVLAKQGIYFMFADAPSFLFNEKGLSEEGKEVIKAVNLSGLLLLVKGLNPGQARALLEGSKKPLILVETEVPEKEILDLAKKKDSAVGLVLAKDADPAAYFEKLKTVKDAIGTAHLMIINDQCLWGEAGKSRMLGVISELIKGKFERMDLSNVFSGVFLRLLSKARGEEGQQAAPYIPF